jgi:hypothetical protein
MSAKVKIVKNERDPRLFTGKLVIKFQNILRNTTQVIIRHRVKIIFSVLNVVRMDERCEFDEWKFQKKKLQTCTRWSRWGHRKNDHVKYVSVYLRSVSSSLIIIPPHNKVVGGYTGFTISVCPSVRL